MKKLLAIFVEAIIKQQQKKDIMKYNIATTTIASAAAQTEDATTIAIAIAPTLTATATNTIL
jgi:hypothetical protein